MTGQRGGGPLEALREKLRAALREEAAPTRQAVWLADVQTRSAVHPSLELTGMADGFDAINIGCECGIERDVTVWLAPDDGAQPHLVVADQVHIGRNTYLGVFQPITIGRASMIGAYCYIISANHVFERRDVPMREQGFAGAPVVIGEDVWLGTHVVVLPGVTVGAGAIVAAGSIVTKDIPDYEIWGGMPAKFLKTRPA